MNKLEIFKNEDGEHKVRTKLVNGHVLYSLTDMAVPFGTSPEKWLRTQQAKDLIAEISDTLKWVSTDLLQVIKGGVSDEQGTWAINNG